MTPKDLAALHAASFSATRAWTTDEFAALLAQPGTRVAGNKDCFVLFRVVVDEAEILTVATHPAKRRQGLARKVLAESETIAKLLGAARIFLEVAEDNNGAIRLYTGSGYTQIGRRPGYYLPKDGAAIAALVLSKTLTTT